MGFSQDDLRLPYVSRPRPGRAKDRCPPRSRERLNLWCPQLRMERKTTEEKAEHLSEVDVWKIAQTILIISCGYLNISKILFWRTGICDGGWVETGMGRDEVSLAGAERKQSAMVWAARVGVVPAGGCVVEARPPRGGGSSPPVAASSRLGSPEREGGWLAIGGERGGWLAGAGTGRLRERRERGSDRKETKNIMHYGYKFSNINLDPPTAWKRIWCSGIIVPSHGTDRGSIPRMRIL
ncbi:hypothetical protein L484_009079 [Morus notabilis]|uniref:Uncharacterized protein n=1 Tax=Morus notabilis TaxID=981085 RepID=W9QU93_9ROSA|nr:hypothetical protein L484_009079 [Morus notabilis]